VKLGGNLMDPLSLPSNLYSYKSHKGEIDLYISPQF
jgi:hypothetical protein